MYLIKPLFEAVFLLINPPRGSLHSFYFNQSIDPEAVIISICSDRPPSYSSQLLPTLQYFRHKNSSNNSTRTKMSPPNISFTIFKTTLLPRYDVIFRDLTLSPPGDISTLEYVLFSSSDLTPETHLVSFRYVFVICTNIFRQT